MNVSWINYRLAVKKGKLRMVKVAGGRSESLFSFFFFTVPPFPPSIIDSKNKNIY